MEDMDGGDAGGVTAGADTARADDVERGARGRATGGLGVEGPAPRPAAGAGTDGGEDRLPGDRGGDRDRDQEFRTYFGRRSAALLRLAYLLTADAAEAEDLTQTALARAYVAWGRVRASDDPDAYVSRILINTHRRRFRRRRVRETPVDVVPDRPAGPGALAGVEDRIGLGAALATLPRRQRAAVILRYCEDLPEARVAAILGCSVGTVKTHASRGLARLRADPALRAFADRDLPPRADREAPERGDRSGGPAGSGPDRVMVRSSGAAAPSGDAPDGTPGRQAAGTSAGQEDLT